MERSCGDCEHWQERGDKGLGSCHRYPPMPIEVESDCFEWFFAEVRAGDWCSEWVKKTQPSERAAKVPIAAYGLSIRVGAAARRLNIYYIAGLTECTDDELLAMPNFGVVSLKEVRRCLGAFGLSLRGEG